MRKEINILYKFNDNSSGSQELNVVSEYEILQLFTAIGPLPSKVVTSVYRDFESPNEKTSKKLCFSSLENLGRFVLELLKEAESPEAFLLSTSDYNIGLDSCNDSEQFQDIFRRYGTQVENPESSIKKKSLFGNLFNK
jgi:hypothetical protein